MGHCSLTTSCDSIVHLDNVSEQWEAQNEAMARFKSCRLVLMHILCHFLVIHTHSDTKNGTNALDNVNICQKTSVNVRKRQWSIANPQKGLVCVFILYRSWVKMCSSFCNILVCNAHSDIPCSKKCQNIHVLVSMSAVDIVIDHLEHIDLTRV